MFILKSTHEKRIAHAREQEQRKSSDAILSYDRAINAERSITKSLREEVERLRPLADKYTARLERDRVHAANKRKAKP